MILLVDRARESAELYLRKTGLEIKQREHAHHLDPKLDIDAQDFCHGKVK